MNPENVFQKILSRTTVSTLIKIRNASWEANQYIRMISEGSSEVWNNDAENSALELKE